MKKVLIILLCSVFLIFGLYVWFTGIHAIPGKVKIIQSHETIYGKAVLFEDKDNHTFGVARLERYLAFFYRFGGSSYGHDVKKGMPFEATGYGTSDPPTDSFVIGVKVAADSNIKYIAIGNDMEDVGYDESYELSMAEVQENPEIYQWKSVVGHYAMFVVDEYTQETWTIRGFDESGNLIADKRFAGQPRYLN
ncbi:hypothetical protein ACFP56_10490 [Paenibacillus septentrionalis]|uniref:DUF5044 domain-containing protein n=1 Tax=Paenibacillus septentrionalis TaxID=429342 RepID=A0ABW1V2M7_9BACL